MPVFHVDDGSHFLMNYEVREGLAAQNILFIHGNMASNGWWIPTEDVWRTQVAGLSLVDAGTPLAGALVFAEFRGCGRSSAPKSESEIDVQRFADDFIALVEHLNRGPFHLVGHSTGGLIVALMLSKRPDLFLRAVLLDPVGPDGIVWNPTLVRAFDRMKSDRKAVVQVVASAIRNVDRSTPFFNDIVVADAFSAAHTVGHSVLKALANLDVRKQVAQIPNPVLVLHGEHDEVLPLEDSRAFADLLPKGEFQILPGLGHSPNIEDPKLFVEVVRRFLF